MSTSLKLDANGPLAEGHILPSDHLGLDVRKHEVKDFAIGTFEGPALLRGRLMAIRSPLKPSSVLRGPTSIASSETSTESRPAGPLADGAISL